MTDKEQVACDALRSAGLDELADNLAFAREAVKFQTVVRELVETQCGCEAGRNFLHDRTCPLVPLLATQPGWLEAEYLDAEKRARAEEGYRDMTQQPTLDRALLSRLERAAFYNTPVPVTVAGRLDQAAELVRLGTVTPEDYLRVVGVDDGASPSVDAYWAGTLRDLKK